MQLKKHYRKLTRYATVSVGTPKNPAFIPRWQLNKTAEAVSQQLISRYKNPQDPWFLGKNNLSATTSVSAA